MTAVIATAVVTTVVVAVAVIATAVVTTVVVAAAVVGVRWWASGGKPPGQSEEITVTAVLVGGLA
ncbi:hypothetical protein [Streptomyces sp. AN091965]|uniref:hypothetical protein n=1 Tax=Streptomyces sp. AN091965 TaxID=2927803 RepID=UPI001F605FAE|nr:hypothetical protein [Streptomyces sp. AN091965]MCI3935239.1 hypothetical protein [Streptomyces sp. AN091965]